MANIFKAYDIRGAYPTQVDETAARKIGAAFVQYLNAKHICVGRDMRLSSPSLTAAFIDGAISAGAMVTDVGMVSTPLLYYSLIEGKYDGGAMVTASHLGGDQNGFKLCRQAAIPLSGDSGLPEIEQLYNQMQPLQPVTRPPDSYHLATFLAPYANKLTTFVHNPKPTKLVIDAGNGMGGLESPLVIQRYPDWHLTPMYLEPDGHFPHHVANPLLPATTVELQARVIQETADIGIAFDGDADRCGYIDEKGQRITSDLVTALVAQALLPKNPGATILYDLRSSRAVAETIEALGGKAVRCRVGHSFIKAQMREVNALFAGELSGHYYYREMGFTDNAALTMIDMLNLLASQDKPLSELVKPLQKYSATGEINMEVHEKDAVFAAIEKNFSDGKITHLDGLSVDYADWWFNLRASNTEPVIRLNLEAGDETTMNQHKDKVLAIIKATDPTMKVEA